MKRVVGFLLSILFAISLFGCSSGGSAILDKAAIKKAESSIKDLAKIVGAYKRMYGKLPPEDKPLEESLKGLITEKKWQSFSPSLKVTKKQMIAKIIDQKGGVKLSTNEIVDILSDYVIGKIKMPKETAVKKLNKAIDKLEIKVVTDSAIPDILNTAFAKEIKRYKRKNKKDLFNFFELGEKLDKIKYERGLKTLITKDDLASVDKDAKKLFRSLLPPFNTDVKKGGWPSPKWIIIRPDKDYVLNKFIENYKKTHRGRKPYGRALKRLKKDVEKYIEMNKTGYVVWMANDSKHTLVYAKVK